MAATKKDNVDQFTDTDLHFGAETDFQHILSTMIQSLSKCFQELTQILCSSEDDRQEDFSVKLWHVNPKGVRIGVFWLHIGCSWSLFSDLIPFVVILYLSVFWALEF